jgi:soluble lytic murein transglycosylase-like protein
MGGRGAWNNDGVGGTKKYKSTAPGPYYYKGTGDPSSKDPNVVAVTEGVRALQAAYNRRIAGTNKPKLLTDGIFGPVTSKAIFDYQTAHEAQTGTPWGGVGPETAEALLRPDIASIVKGTAVPEKMVSGAIRTESLYDPGAVGKIDPNDYGLAQINGPSHPNLSVAQRLNPLIAFAFVRDYFVNALDVFGGNKRDAAASYNLGIGGTRKWIAAGRPDVWKPTATSKPRNVKAYIDKILAG